MTLLLLSVTTLLSPLVRADDALSQKEVAAAAERAKAAEVTKSDATGEANENSTANKGIFSETGALTDPATYPGVTFGFQGGLSGGDSYTFGYDSLSAQVRWTPGTNKIGRRISLMGGLATWHSPAASDLYTSEVLPADAATRYPAQSVSVAMVGGSFAFGTRSSALSEYKSANPGGADREALNQEKDYSFGGSVGALIRAPVLENGASAQAIDAFAVLATGFAKDGLDTYLTVHRVQVLDGTLFERSSTSAALEGYLNLDDSTAQLDTKSCIGLAVRGSLYDYAPLGAQAEDGTILTDQPRQYRLDAMASIGGAPDKSGGNAAAVGIQYTHVALDGGREDRIVKLLFGSNFRFQDTIPNAK